MRTVKFIFALLLLLLVNVTQAQETLSVSGKFKNFNPYADRDIMPTVIYCDEYMQYSMKTTSIDSTGYFKIDIPKLHKTQVITIQIMHYLSGKFILTSDLHINLDVKKTYLSMTLKPHVSFSGTDAGAAFYYEKYADRFAVNQPRKISKTDTLSEEEYDLKLKEHHDHATRKLPTSVKQTLDQEFEMDRRIYAYSKAMSKPAPINSLKKGPRILSTNSARFYSFAAYYLSGQDVETSIKTLSEIATNDLDTMEQIEFNKFIEHWRKLGFNTRGDSLFKAGYRRFYVPHELDIYKARVSFLKKNIEEQKLDYVNELLVARIPINVEMRKIYYDSLRHLFSESWARNSIDLYKDSDEEALQLASNEQKEIDGSQHPLGIQVYENDSISMYISRGENMNNVIGSIIEEYPDKVIILDIWTTWCGPCISDMKASRKNKKKLQANDIVVVYLCDGTGEGAATWIQKVRTMGTNGKHILINNNQRKQLFSQYGFQGYPSYLVIDKNRKFHTDKVHRITYIKPKLFLSKLEISD